MHTAVTSSPTDAWTAQQLREATPWGQKPRFLIRDNDRKYGKQFSAVARSSGGWTVTSNSVSPVAAITFPASTGGTGGTVTHFAVGTAASGTGKILFGSGCTVTPNIVVSSGVTPSLTTATAITLN